MSQKLVMQSPDSIQSFIKIRHRHSKIKRSRFCGVCGDVAKSYHFGGISCDSCKAFFRRAVTNNNYHNFHCLYSYNCFIDIASRKFCQYCRFRKCMSIGMNKLWVMTEEEKLSMHLQRKESQLKTKEDYQLQLFNQTKDIGNSNLTIYDNIIIHSIMEYFEESIKSFPFPQKLLKKENFSSIDIAQMFVTSIHRIIGFAQKLDFFQKLTNIDKIALLKGSALEIFMLRFTMILDLTTLSFPAKNMLYWQSSASPVLQTSQVQKVFGWSSEIYQPQIKFIKNMKEMNLDENTLIFLSLVVLFSPNRKELSDYQKIFEEQKKYCILLKKYLILRFGPENGLSLYAELLLKLPELRKLGNYLSQILFENAQSLF